jgi:hypothetical protein
VKPPSFELDERPPLGFRLRTRLRRTPLARALYRRRWNRRADVVLISFPKAGRTWLRLLLAKSLALRFGVPEGELLELHRMAERHPGMPRIRVKHDDDPQLKTPDELVAVKSEYRDRKVVLLVRDLRDLVVSTYFQMSRREKRYSKDLASFLRCPRGSIDTMIRFYDLWAANRQLPAALLLVRYEDLQRDTAGELRRILDFVGVRDVPDALVREAVAFASFDNMRRMEESDAAGSGRLRPGDRRDPESFKTRRGRIGGFAEYLSPEEVRWLDERIARELSPWYGYGRPGEGAARVSPSSAKTSPSSAR